MKQMELFAGIGGFGLAGEWRGAIDIVSGGFPCQSYSNAGRRLGNKDDRHLWPEMLRVIREVAPCWVVVENVRGIINWNGGLVFNEVQAELESSGYEVVPFLLPACGTNAYHERYRVWFITYANKGRLQTKVAESGKNTSLLSKASNPIDRHPIIPRYVAKRGSAHTIPQPFDVQTIAVFLFLYCAFFCADFLVIGAIAFIFGV